MEFRLTDGRRELAMFEATDADELASALQQTRNAWYDPDHTSRHVHVHLRHGTAWWNLTSDLSQFGSWLVEARGRAPDEVSHFTSRPWEQPALLWEAAHQLTRLLDAAAAFRSGASTSSTGLDEPQSQE